VTEKKKFPLPTPWKRGDLSRKYGPTKEKKILYPLKKDTENYLLFTRRRVPFSKRRAGKKEKSLFPTKGSCA